MRISKSDLRTSLKSQRKKLSAVKAETFSQQIVDKCVGLVDWQNIKNVHVYSSVLRENEINTQYLLDYIWHAYPAIQTVVPRLNRRDEYDSVVVSPATKWQSEDVRIPEPIGGKVLVADSKFDVIIVPMLGFDDSGHRLGHGKGWYDRFLASQPQAVTIGLCYEVGLVRQGLPHEPHDIALKYIATETNIRKL